MSEPVTLGTLLRQKLGYAPTPKEDLNVHNSMSLHAHLINLTANSQKAAQNKRLFIKSQASDFVRVNQILKGWEMIDKPEIDLPFTMFLFESGAFFCIRGNPEYLRNLTEFLSPAASGVYGTRQNLIRSCNLHVCATGPLGETPILTRAGLIMEYYKYIGSMQKLANHLIKECNFPERIRKAD